jgi:hypothetical protein
VFQLLMALVDVPDLPIAWLRTTSLSYCNTPGFITGHGIFPIHLFAPCSIIHTCQVVQRSEFQMSKTRSTHVVQAAVADLVDAPTSLEYYIALVNTIQYRPQLLAENLGIGNPGSDFGDRYGITTGILVIHTAANLFLHAHTPLHFHQQIFITPGAVHV